MKLARALPAPIQRGLGLAFGREQPWRRSFLVLRALQSRDATSSLAVRARDRFEAQLSRYPDAVVPYLDYLAERLPVDQVKQYAQALAARPGTRAGVLVEVAKFHYLRNSLSVGDGLIERAKELEPGLARIYDEEAWNQRARGNVHRELHAVEKSIELADDEAARLQWRGWRIEVLVRLDRLEEAWEEFSSFPALDAGDERLLTAAYCARQLGMHRDVERLYTQFAPADDGFDTFAVASLQFEKYQHADEVAALLPTLDEHSETRLLDMSFRARVQLGELDTGIAHAQIAMLRDDCPRAMKSHLGQLLELLDRPEEAIVAYLSARPKQRSLLHRFRLASLLAERDHAKAAVTSYLEDLELADDLPTDGLAREVDPQLAELVNQYNRRLVLPLRVEHLEQIAARASSRKLRWQALMRLAAQCAVSEEWDRAWTAICTAQYKRLPSIQLTLPQWSDLGSSRNMYYHECTETEPLQRRTVLYESSLGGSTSCNPLAICLELLTDPDHADLLHVWSIESDAVVHPALRDRPNVVFVRKGSSGHFRYLASAGAVINNSTLEYNFTKRDGQRYLNTWHGVPWKTMGRDNRSEPFAYGNIARNFLHADFVLGPDQHTLDVLSRGHDVDELVPQVFVRSGYPRNDLSVNLPEESRHAIRTELGARDGEHLVVYMPTWKGTFAERDAEVQSVIETARGLAAPGFRVAVRAHHYVSSAFRTTPPGNFAFVPAQIDTNELIGAVDAVVTDFSSVLFDAAAVGVPVVTLTDDIEAYTAERGLYFSADDVPGANARSTAEARAELQRAVRDPAAFTASYAAQTERFSSPETGTSARRAVELLFGEPRPEAPERAQRHRSVLISTGGLPPNGITRSVRSLIAALESSEYTPYLIPNRNALEGAESETLADVRAYAKVLPMVSLFAGTRMEREALQFFSTRRYVDYPLVKRFVRASQQREARRLFGATAFHAAVEFSAYDAKNIALIGYGVRVDGGRRGIIFHNEMWKEVENKYPRLRPGLLSMDEMDFYASVSDGVRDYNSRTMHEHLGVPVEKHITIENTINVDEIRQLAQIPLDAEDVAWYGTEGAHACVIARLSHEKNHAELFHALAESRDRLSRPVKLTCLGDGPLRLELQELVTRLGIDDLVRMRGLVPNPQAHLQAAGALVLPSLHEGQPLVLLEALTVGTPVVATDTPGSRSALHDGAFGPLVPISREGLIDALHRVADGRLNGSREFDAESFTRHSLRMFIEAIDPGALDCGSARPAHP
ncbi:glycosyltransferase [Leucobacter sp. L43]|uniref:CDP-glycerol glycerophosphotransferase family protein n=1 Tax=Leucobacter sp. L43 TaxID=2798040 RepID=UPI0019048618